MSNKVFVVLLFSTFIFFSCLTEINFEFDPIIPSVTENSVQLYDELSVLFPDDLSQGISLTELTTVGNGRNAFYLLVDVMDSTTETVLVTVNLKNLEGAKNLTFAQVIEVPVEINTGLFTHTTVIDGRDNPYVVRKAPFMIYEIDKPIHNQTNEGFQLSQTGRALYLVEFETDPISEKRKTEISLQVNIGENVFSHAINVQQYPIILDQSKEMKYVVWNRHPMLEEEWGIEEFSDEWFEKTADIARLMRKGGQSVAPISWSVLFDENPSEPTKPIFQEERVNRYIQTFLDAGISQFTSTNFAGREGEKWAAKNLMLHAGMLASSPEAKIYLENAFGALSKYLTKMDLMDKWFLSISDEPIKEHSADYRLLADYVHQFLPGVPVLEASIAKKELVGAVDIWTPMVQDYEKDRRFFDERIAAGDRVWVYTCLNPAGNYLNRMLDQERIRQVLLAWAGNLYNIEGYLHWGFNWFKVGVDPWKRTVLHFHYNGDVVPENVQLPAGDPYIAFPYNRTHIGGARLRAMAIGMQDFVLLQMLREKDPVATEKLIKTLVRGYKNYSKSIEEYRDVKKTLLEALL